MTHLQNGIADGRLRKRRAQGYETSRPDVQTDSTQLPPMWDGHAAERVGDLICRTELTTTQATIP